VKVVLTSIEGFTPPCSPNLASRVARAIRSTGSMSLQLLLCTSGAMMGGTVPQMVVALLL
jgi:hypothetical protein